MGVFSFMYEYNQAFSNFKNFSVLNEFQLSQQAIALSKTSVNTGKPLSPNQELLHMKYQSVCFNLYSSILMFTNYTNYDETIGLIYLQASNNYLQSAWDCLYQMLNIFKLDKKKALNLLKDDEEREKYEKQLSINNYIKNNKNDTYIKHLDTIYKINIKAVRDENNYVKHNGHVSSSRNRKDFKVHHLTLKIRELQI